MEEIIKSLKLIHFIVEVSDDKFSSTFQKRHIFNMLAPNHDFYFLCFHSHPYKTGE